MVTPNKSGKWKAIKLDDKKISSNSLNLLAFNNEQDLKNYFSVGNIKNIPKRKSKTIINVYRYQGSNRYDTASNFSASNFISSDYVVLVNAKNYSDGLAATNLATQLDSPILYTNGSDLDTSTVKEIDRLKAKSVYIIGGENTISYEVNLKLKKINSVSDTIRIEGSSRTKTAIEIAKVSSKLKASNTVILVSGLSYADALSVGALSGKNGSPVLYATSSSLDLDTREYIKRNYDEVIIVGGINSVNLSIENDIRDNLHKKVNRIAGSNRYETSEMLARVYFSSPNSIYLASGENYVDALMGGVVAAKKNVPLILVNGNELTSSLSKYIKSNDIKLIYILGGENSISYSYENALKQVYDDSDSRTKVINALKNELGKPYKLGGNGPYYFDCSGLVQTTYRNTLGIVLYRTTQSQVGQGREVSWDEMLPGDLMFFKADDIYPDDISHVSVYIGNGQMIHAKNEDTGVVIDSIYNSWWKDRLSNIRNVID